MINNCEVSWDKIFYIKFNSEQFYSITFKQLRYLCPCAACVNELSGKRNIKLDNINSNIHPLDCSLVGNYAIRIFWSDNHSTGIYSYNYLYKIYKQQLKES